MADSFLQCLLNEGHLRDLGEDKTRFDFLTGAVGTLSEFLSSEAGGAEVVSFTIVGLDPETPPDDPIFDRVTKAVVEEWPTYGNVYRGDRPRQLLRMVVLAAIDAAAAFDGAVAAAAWYTASNWLTLGPTLEGALGAFVARLGLQTEEQAVELWKRPSTETSFRMPSRTIAEMKPLSTFTLKKDLITGDLQESIAEGITNLRINSQYGRNNPDAWVTEMVPKLAAVILSAATSGGNAAINRINEAGLVSAEGMKEFAASIGDKVREALAEAERAASGRDLRSDLLWWRQSLYSPSQRGSYRDLDTRQAVLVMAVDLHVLVPTLTPHSVEFVLRETARASGLDAEIGLADLVALARDHRDLWSERYPTSVPERPRRVPVLTAALAEHGGAEDWLGPASAASLSAPDAAVWLFRELQASRLVASS